MKAKHLPKTALILALAAALTLALTGCENGGTILGANAEKNGVTFSINESWNNTLTSDGGNITCDSCYITVDTFTNTQLLTFYDAAEAGADIKVGARAYEHDGGLLSIKDGYADRYNAYGSYYSYTVVIGRDSSLNKGFLIFFDR